MGYNNVLKISMLATHHMVSYTDFINMIKRWRFRAFSVKAVRDAMRNEVENLHAYAFDSTGNVRFTQHEVIIDLSHSVPGRLLRNLMLALDVSTDREVEIGRETRAADLQSRAFTSINDAKVAFHNSLEAILDLSAGSGPASLYIYGIYTRDTFERVHNLGWTD